MSEQGKLTQAGSGSGGVLDKAGVPVAWDVGRRITGASVKHPIKLEEGRIAIELIKHVVPPQVLDATGFAGNDLAVANKLNEVIVVLTELLNQTVHAGHMGR